MSEEIQGVDPIDGEIISVDEIVKGIGLKEGADLDYTTPKGLQIKAQIKKGAPVNIAFFHKGKQIRPKPYKIGDVILPDIELHVPPPVPKHKACLYVYHCIPGTTHCIKSIVCFYLPGE